MDMSSKAIYLDHAAATPLDPEVLEAMKPYLEESFYNPSSLYQAARTVREAVDQARWEVAQLLGAKKTEIIFTAGGTESTNLAVLGFMRAQPKGCKLITSVIEHEAVLACLPTLHQEGYISDVVPVKPDGIVDINKLVDAIDDQTVLISVMYANNEIGTIQPIGDIAKQVNQIRADRLRRNLDLPLYFHTDACQAGGLLDLHVSRLGVDLMTLNGSKIYGPKQSGCLYIRTGTEIVPLVVGGGQERGQRSGTENVAGIIGFSAALQLSQLRRGDEAERLAELRDYLLQGLRRAIPDLMLNGHPTKRLANNLNITIPGIDGETAVLYLDQQKILCSTGSACSTGNTDPSHVLLAIGRSLDEATASLRFTLGRSNKVDEIEAVIQVLPTIIARLRQLG